MDRLGWISHRLDSLSDTSQSAVQALGFDRRGVYVFSIQGRRLLGSEINNFNYEMFYDIKMFLCDFNVKFRIVFMADHAVTAGDKMTLDEGSRLLQAFFPESLSKDPITTKFDILCEGIELIWDKKFFSRTHTP